MKEFRLGVLFVHGIGTQPPRDTLVRWGDALLKVVGLATGEGPGRTIPTVVHADAGDHSGDKPAEVVVEFRSHDRHRSEKWLLCEGWWAESFPAPTYAELASWSFRAAPWAIALHIAERFWQNNPKASKGAWIWAIATATAQLLVAMALTPVFMVLLAFTLVLGLLPFAELRALILTMQTMFIQTVGDSLAFVESPLRAAFIRGRILQGLERLKGRCDRTIIVAHSQGAAVTLDALGGILDHCDERGDSSEPERPVPDALVTFGSGVNQLVSLKVLLGGRFDRSTDTNPAAVAVMATLGMMALLVILFLGIRSGSINIEQLARAFVFISVFWLGSALLIWGLLKMLDKLAAWGVLRAQQEAAHKKFRIRAAAVIYLAVSLIGFHFAEDLTSDLPILHVVFLVAVVANLVVSLVVILQSGTRSAVTRPVRHPPRLSSWMDVYASADPVPNGPTRIEVTSAIVTSVKIWNRGSFLSDHTTYWENLDGFVLRIARICAETAGSSWRDKLPPVTQDGWRDRRSERRVALLRWILRGNALLWVSFFIYLIWMRYEAHVPLPFSFPQWFWDWGPTTARIAILTALVALAAWVAAALLRWRWSVWVRAEQEAVLARKSVGVVPWPKLPFSGLGTVICLVGALPITLALGFESETSKVLTNPQFWLFAAVGIMGMGTSIEWIAYWMLRPQPANIESDNVGP